MTAVTDYSDWKTLSGQGNARGGMFEGFLSNGAFSTPAAGPSSMWSRLQYNNTTAQAPGAAAAVDQSHAAALLRNPALPGTLTNKLWLAEGEYAMSNTGSLGMRSAALLCDRLSHQSGLSGTVTTAQTTNLPTAALTRYTSGDGVWPCIEIYALLGSTLTTVTASYTNQAGVAGRTTQAITIGGTAGSDTDFAAVNYIRPLTLQDGDTGCRSVESVTVAATTGTAGNFGIVLLKPLAFLPADTGAAADRLGWRNMLFGGGVVEVLPSACLMLMSMLSSNATGPQAVVGRLGLAEK